MKKKTGKAPVSLWHWWGLIAVCLLVFANSLTGGFVWDDEVQVVNVKNPRIRSVDVGGAFGSGVWDFAVTEETRTNYYRHVQTLTYSVAYLLAGLAPWAYHLFSLLCHVVAVTVLFGILIELSFFIQGGTLPLHSHARAGAGVGNRSGTNAVAMARPADVDARRYIRGYEPCQESGLAGPRDTLPHNARSERGEMPRFKVVSVTSR